MTILILGMFLIVLSNNYPLNELFTRFYSHETGRKLYLTSSIVDTFDKLGIKYTLSSACSTINITSAFKDNFTSTTNKHILDFIAQTKLKEYPPVVAEKCVAYLKELSSGKPEEYLLEHISDWICVKC